MDASAGARALAPGFVDPLAGSTGRLERTARAASNSGKTADLEKAASEFESLFVAYLLKVMRETIQEAGGEGTGLGKDIYTELFDHELARSIGKRGALGVADLIVRRVSNPTGAAAPTGPAASAPAAPSNEPPTAESEVPDFRLPVQAPVSSGFGPRRDPFTREVRFHKGIDLAAPEGLTVRAALGGEVVFAGRDGAYGNTVVLRHPGGLQTRYAHLRSLSVRPGDVVSNEQSLGVVGSTGRATGAHLHFEVSREGKAVDPRTALDFGARQGQAD